MTLKLKGYTDVDITKEEKEGRVRDVSNQAIWSLSSCKPGCGIEQLLDPSTDTYWQSDGPQPHYVNVQFRRKTALSDICLYIDFGVDESYTPSRLGVRIGSHLNDLVEIEQVELQEPYGWVVIPLKGSCPGRPVRAFMLQIAILNNHQNGRDTHLRRMKIHSPIGERLTGDVSNQPPFLSTECKMLNTIR